MNMLLLLLGAPSHKHSFPKLWQARSKCNFILQGPLPEQYFISYQQFMISGAECDRLSVGLQRLSINILGEFLKIAFMIGTGMITILIYHCNSSLAQMPKRQFPLQ